jgi:hypothetical protein
MIIAPAIDTAVHSAGKPRRRGVAGCERMPKLKLKRMETDPDRDRSTLPFNTMIFDQRL